MDDLEFRTAQHLRRLKAMGIPTTDHGLACITRDAGPWQRPEHDPGTLRQTCPCCGRDEYRGSFCTGCFIPTGANDWYQREVPASLAAHIFGRGGQNGPSCVGSPDSGKTTQRINRES